MLKRRLLPIILLLAAIAGCNKHVVLNQDFPVPIMEKEPYTVGLDIGPELRNYRHFQAVFKGPDWTVDFGESNAILFTRIFDGMFRATVPNASVGQSSANGQPLDAVIKPVLVDFQLSTPEQSASKFYEAWLKYRLELYDPSGKMITSWEFSSYGRRKTQTMGTEASFREACRRAMRDAAAAIFVGFLEQPGVRAYFDSKKGS